MAMTEGKKSEKNSHHSSSAAAATTFTASNASASKKKSAFMAAVAVLRFRAALLLRQRRPPLVVITLYGRRRGHVHIAFQSEPQAQPFLLVELPTATNELVREMAASGLMRIALECDREAGGGGAQLLEEPVWRVYCNGLRCGFAVRRECGPEDWKVLHAVGPVSVGAGVLPAAAGVGGDEGEVMYMRARFERVVGSKDSEAFYMLNPDGNGGPDQLSLYLLRV